MKQYDKGYTCAEQKKYQLAVDEYSKSILLDHNNSLVYHARANAYSDFNLQNEAIADYTKAIKLNPDDSSSFKLRG